jgi:O-antigen/teichoic acid export membrane protein
LPTETENEKTSERAGFGKMGARLTLSLSGRQLSHLALGLADQGFSAGGMFLANVALARTESKEHYGAFALSYSIFMFLAGLHQAAVLEPYTVYGSGRYRSHLPEYSQLMLRGNLIAGVALSVLLLSACLLLRWFAPEMPLRSLLGLGLTVPIIFTGAFLRRGFYIRRLPAAAARMSMVFFTTLVLLLWMAASAHVLDNFSVFAIVALSWIAAGAVSLGNLDFSQRSDAFADTHPGYRHEHWHYARWVLATALVFQFLYQGYYWLVAGFLAVSEVGELKAMYLLVAPVEQIVISMSFLILPALTARYSASEMDSFLSLGKLYVSAVAAVTLLFAGAVRLLGARVMHTLYAGKYDGLAGLLSVLAWVPLLTCVGGAICDGIKAAERPRLVFYAFLVSAAATLAAGMPLVVYFGLRGAVYGMVLSSATYATVSALAFWIYVPKRGEVLEMAGLQRGEPARSL